MGEEGHVGMDEEEIEWMRRREERKWLFLTVDYWNHDVDPKSPSAGSGSMTSVALLTLSLFSVIIGHLSRRSPSTTFRIATMDTLGRPLSFHQQHPNNRESWVERAYGQDQPVASRSTLDVSRPAESPRISPSPGMTRTSSDYPSGSKYQALGGPWSHSARNSYLNPDSPQFSAVPLSGGEARPLSYPSQRSQAGEIDATSREHLDSPATQRPAESEEGTEGAAGGKTRSSTRNSDGSVTVNGTPRSEGKRELERPSEKAFTRAAMANTIAANEQHAAHYRLATSGGQEPDGWTSVPPVSPKYHIHHKELSKERKQAMKVRLARVVDLQ